MNYIKNFFDITSIASCLFILSSPLTAESTSPGQKLDNAIDYTKSTSPGQKLDNAIDYTKEGVDKAKENVEKKADQARDKVNEARDKIGEKIKHTKN